MPGIVILLVLIAIVCILSGPIALIKVISLSNKVNELLLRRPEKKVSAVNQPEPKVTIQPVEKAELKANPPIVPVRTVPLPEKIYTPTNNILLEQKIGTRWIPVAGVITLFVGVAFFLKFAYENFSMSPLTRVVAVSICGLIALAAGEITRRRGYDIAAKGVTSLGFAVLYAAVFSAYQFYDLIGSVPAFILATTITAGAMLYAVVLNEILIAFLSLLGGFSAPFILLPQIISPTPLFIYILILGVGAMLCASYRKWPAVNFLAFAGTYLLFSMWFYNITKGMIAEDFTSPQRIYILNWLAIFFVIYLVMPIIHELVQKVKTNKEDVLLILINSIVTFCYLCCVLYEHHRYQLALATIVLSAVHLIMMTLVIKRCKDDKNLKIVLLTIGLFFFTVAIPLYFKANALIISWTGEAIVLTVIGLRYRSARLQIAAVVPLILSCMVLAIHLSSRSSELRFIFNPDFGTWCIVAAAVFVMHLIYRFIKPAGQDIKETYSIASQFLYCLSCILLFIAAIVEWTAHCKFQLALSSDSPLQLKGLIVICIPAILLLITRPVCPKGIYHKVLAAILAAAGSLFTIMVFTEFYRDKFTIFANVEFTIAFCFVLALLIAAWLMKNTFERDDSNNDIADYFALVAIVVLWVLLTEQIYLYWYCLNKYAQPLANWKLLAHMYISITWAIYGAVLMVIGFWKNIRTLRFIAISLFAILLLKVFIIDTRAMENVYRIAAFLATGGTLIGVSYMYQFLKKKGFFDSILPKDKVEL